MALFWLLLVCVAKPKHPLTHLHIVALQVPSDPASSREVTMAVTMETMVSHCLFQSPLRSRTTSAWSRTSIRPNMMAHHGCRHRCGVAAVGARWALVRPDLRHTTCREQSPQPPPAGSPWEGAELSSSRLKLLSSLSTGRCLSNNTLRRQDWAHGSTAPPVCWSASVAAAGRRSGSSTLTLLSPPRQA